MFYSKVQISATFTSAHNINNIKINNNFLQFIAHKNTDCIYLIFLNYTSYNTKKIISVVKKSSKKCGEKKIRDETYFDN